MSVSGYQGMNQASSQQRPIWGGYSGGYPHNPTFPGNQPWGGQGLQTMSAGPGIQAGGFQGGAPDLIEQGFGSFIRGLVKTVGPVLLSQLQAGPMQSQSVGPLASGIALNEQYIANVAQQILAQQGGLNQQSIFPAGLGGPDTQGGDLSQAGFWDIVRDVVKQVGPVLLKQLGTGPGMGQMSTGPGDLQQQGFWDVVSSIVKVAAPVVLSMLNTGPGAGGQLQGQSNQPDLQQQGFWDVIGSIAKVAAPIVLSLLQSGPQMQSQSASPQLYTQGFWDVFKGIVKTVGPAIIQQLNTGPGMGQMQTASAGPMGGRPGYGW